MINEIAFLKNSLDKCKIEISSIHPAIKSPSKKDGFLIRISPESEVEHIEYNSAEQMSKMWMIMPDNQKRFPVINFKVPIWTTDQDHEEVANLLDNKDISAQCSVMLDLIEKGTIAYPKQQIKKLKQRLYDYPTSLLDTLLCNNPEIEIITQLIKRLQKFKDSPESFLKKISYTAIEKCKTRDLSAIDLVQTMLFGKWNKARKEFTSSEIQIAFDLSDYHKFDYCVTDCNLSRKVNKILLQKENSKGSEQNTKQAESKCAISGETTIIQTGSYPEPNLPIIGPSFIFSMNKNAPCHLRYGKTGSGIFPVGKNLTYELQNALLYLTEEDRKGKTWQAVPGNKRTKGGGTQPDLLVIYLQNKPQTQIRMANIFVEADEDEQAEASFEHKASTICSALKGEPGINSNSLVKLFVLTQIDKGRRQVLLNTEYTVEQIIKGVEQWNIAAKNHPNFEIPLPVKKGQKAQIAEPLCPSPASVMRCFQNQWIRQGQEKSPLAGCNLLEIYSVFLGEPNQTEKLYHKLLQLGLQRWMPLFLGIGQADHNHEITTFSTEARKTILTAISTFGILLYKLGYKKEGYMKEAAFNIGRLLSLADGLHKEYCKNVRKNEIPAQLIGNSLMPITLDNPKRGFARLSKRILIYIAWIDKGWESKDENKKKELRGARGHRNRMGEVCNILSKLELPEKTDDSQKAMILLGYLYKSKKKVNNEENKGIKQ